ncbi:MAG: PAS domain-containing protein [Elusimicrobiota bacterium]|jgi:PAS domain S-box-containing protein
MQPLFEHPDFQVLIDTLPDPLHVMDADFRILVMNKAFRQLNAELGLTADIVGMTLEEAFPFLGPCVREEYRRVLEGKETLITEELNVLGSRRIHTETKKTPLVLPDGRAGVVTLIRDITVHKLVAEALLAERELFTGGPTVVLAWGAENGWPVEYASPNVREALGYEVGDLLSGRIRYMDLVHPEDLPRVKDEVARFCADGLPSYEQEYRLRHADGIYRWVRQFSVVKRDDGGGIARFHGYVIDITAHRNAEDEIARLTREGSAARKSAGRSSRKKPS